MSIAAQCPECCECPIPFFQTDAVSYSGSPPVVFPSFDGDFNDGNPGAHYDLSEDGLSVNAGKCRYRARAKIPKVGTGLNYRITWNERFIPEGGVGIDSVDVVSRGVFRPAVAISSPPFGGTQAYAVAVMSPTGQVSSIRILNPGYGYSTAPAVTLSASGSGSSATGWVATLDSNGRITTITGGTGGAYLPTITITFDGDYLGAVLAPIMDEQGGLSSVAVTASGAGHEWPLVIEYTNTTGAFFPEGRPELIIHFGTENPRCAVWDGITPPGYDPEDPATYPIIGDAYYELDAPASNGFTQIGDVRSFCDGSACP